MNFEDIELYNVGALEKIEGLGDNSFVRVPEEIRHYLNNRARFIAMDSVGCEMRFVTDAPFFDLYVSVNQPEFLARGEIRIFKGNFQCQVLEVEPGKVNNFRITNPQALALPKKEILNKGGFNSDVWRIIFGRSTYNVHRLDTFGYNLRLPKAKEKPIYNWLAYGSSITNSDLDGYPHFAARKLRLQVQNKGMGGACHIERVLVDYFVDQCEWDLATCELGINMRGMYTAEEFRERAAYLVKRFSATGKPVLIISIFPNGSTEGKIGKCDQNTEREADYNKILESLVEEAANEKIMFIHGYEILDDFTGLSGDMVHPSLYGHAIMGINLAERLESILIAVENSQ